MSEEEAAQIYEQRKKMLLKNLNSKQNKGNNNLINNKDSGLKKCSSIKQLIELKVRSR